MITKPHHHMNDKKQTNRNGTAEQVKTRLTKFGVDYALTLPPEKRQKFVEALPDVVNVLIAAAEEGGEEKR